MALLCGATAAMLLMLGAGGPATATAMASTTATASLPGLVQGVVGSVSDWPRELMWTMTHVS